MLQKKNFTYLITDRPTDRPTYLLTPPQLTNNIIMINILIHVPVFTFKSLKYIIA
jgi:hypothetical protein